MVKTPTPCSALPASDDDPLPPDDIRTVLLHLTCYGFVSARYANRMIEAGYAVPIALTVRYGGDWPCELEAIRLTAAGRTIASRIGWLTLSESLDPTAVPEWERAITEDYIHGKADTGVYAASIICAKVWYTGPSNPERRVITQPDVALKFKPRRKHPRHLGKLTLLPE